MSTAVRTHSHADQSNSDDDDMFRDYSPEEIDSAAKSRLKSIVDRVERLEVEKAEIMEQIKEVYAEAKGEGFDVKVLKKAVRIRKMDRNKRLEEESILDLYLSALGDA